MTNVNLHGVVDALKPEHEKYAKALKTAGEAFEEAYNIFNDKDYNAKTGGWKADTHAEGASVHSKSFPFGNLFAVIDGPIDLVFKETITDFEKTSVWNSNIVFSKVVAALTEHVDIIHYANPDVAVVKSRDFVIARLWRKIGDHLYIAGRSVEVDDVKETKERVRAKLHLGCGRLSPVEGNKTKIEYLLSIDFKGFIPKGVVNAVMGKLILKDFEETVKHFAEMKK